MSDEPLTLPKAPRSLAGLGLSGETALEILLRIVHSSTGEEASEIARRAHVPFPVAYEGLDILTQRRHLHVAGGDAPPAYRYVLTDAGLALFHSSRERSSYAGAMPVPLGVYREILGRHLARPQVLTREKLLASVKHLVVGEDVLDLLGPAVNSGLPIFLFGPPGCGKTTIARAVGEVLAGEVPVPHAIEIDGQVITVFDPGLHRPVDAAAAAGARLFKDDAAEGEDGRWIRCRAPFAVVAGELRIADLDILHHPSRGIHEAPIQMKANGGMLLVDDFGRQRDRARDLLDRFILPMEEHQDVLTILGGKKITVPFRLILFYSTNIDPRTLVDDEAFFRRLQYKIHMRAPSEVEFRTIFSAAARTAGLADSTSACDHLLKRHLAGRNRALRGCQPRDILEKVVTLSRYRGRTATLTPDAIDEAARLYFLDE